MNTKKISAFLLFLAVPLTGLSQETKNPTAPTDSDGDVALHYGKEIAVSDHAAQMLRSAAIELVETSDSNSSIPALRDKWGLAKIQADYRKTVAGKYLLVSFKQPRKIKTIGGDITVLEVVIGLNRSDYASDLYTIDDEGRVVSHAMYSGPLCIEILKLVKITAE